mgnify:CR=1 FL=1
MTPAESLKMSPPIRVLEFEYLGPVDGRGSQVKITDRRFNRSVLIPYDYEFTDAGEMAWDYLATRGWLVRCISREPDVIICAWNTGEPLQLGGES